MAHKGAYAVSASKLESDKKQYARRAKSPVVKEAMRQVRIVKAKAKAKKAEAAQKAAHSKLSSRESLLQKVGKGLRNLRRQMSGDSARTTRISKLTTVKTDSQRRASKRKRY